MPGRFPSFSMSYARSLQALQALENTDEARARASAASPCDFYALLQVLRSLDSELLAAAFLARCDFDAPRALEAPMPPKDQDHPNSWGRPCTASESGFMSIGAALFLVFHHCFGDTKPTCAGLWLRQGT